MTIHRMDQETAERLLVGPVVNAQDGPEVLIRLLAAVRAAPRPHELAGEGAAVQAFRAARAGLLPAASRAERRFVASMLGAKIALAALLATATGGVALAAATGTLPDPLTNGGDNTTTPSAGTARPTSPTTGPDASPGRTAPGASPRPTAGPTGQPSSPSFLTGLCTAYLARADENRRRALETPRFADLVSIAGGRDKVAGYCERLLDERERQNGATGQPGRPPTGGGNRQPAGGPATAATPAATVPSTIRPAVPSVRLPGAAGTAVR
ncbi:hypothetical protein ONA91_11335 [Micromonospora sp. DR5-3]|uniref:hypothetical protein n=1 Tax=unclassified Micromonospora TaxID=2617518 RepID=UPI0011D9D1BA|nr:MULTISPECIES: hypothetical protein [unclassified Micromonospora]MCW3815048.1 hypothetical protein [Micromonospora sp. DR5-3]TYC25363.1 hypothetical protein FXF52_06085 [Micromonospora sp. MP36]